MSRPKAVNIKTFPLYNKLHTEVVKMYSGVTMTALYPIKETSKYFVSPEVWAFCCRKFKHKKEGFKLSVTIPTISDAKTLSFLERKCWKDYISKNIDREDSDLKEAISLLHNIFPDKEPVYFYELDSIINGYTSGTFISYDDNGNVEQLTVNKIENCKYYTNKFCGYEGHKDPVVKEAYDAYLKAEEGVGSQEYKNSKFLNYYTLLQDYNYKNLNLNEVFIEIGRNVVCYPVAFKNNTADWSKNKYGKLIGYAHAGEIFFVVTPNKIYFEIQRHF